MRLFHRLLVSIAYCGIFVYCQRGSSGGIKGNTFGAGSRGSGNFAGSGSNINSKSCKGGACKNSELVIFSTFGGLGGMIMLLTMICYCYKRCVCRWTRRNSLLMEAKTKVSKDYTPCDERLFKSGSWSGRYLQFGVWFGPHCYTLSFDSISFKIIGSGLDDVGAFAITGTYSKEKSRMVLIKKYQLGTGDPLGNLGHHVLIQLVWNSVTCQFEGDWHIKTEVYCGQDQFELKHNDETKLWIISTTR